MKFKMWKLKRHFLFIGERGGFWCFFFGFFFNLKHHCSTNACQCLQTRFLYLRLNLNSPKHGQNAKFNLRYEIFWFSVVQSKLIVLIVTIGSKLGPKWGHLMEHTGKTLKNLELKWRNLWYLLVRRRISATSNWHKKYIKNSFVRFFKLLERFLNH